MGLLGDHPPPPRGCPAGVEGRSWGCKEEKSGEGLPRGGGFWGAREGVINAIAPRLGSGSRAL